MNFFIKLTLFVCITILFTNCAQTGFVLTNKTTVDSTLSLLEQAKQSNGSPPKIEYRKLKDSDVPLLDDMPVGAVLPYVIPPSGFNLSEKWQAAIGQIVTDPESPFFQKRLPDLNGVFSPFKPTYLAGTFSTTTYGKVFGRNDIPTDGNHKHQRLELPEHGFGDDHADNQYETNNKGNHNHGGDNRPRTMGIVYIIKIK